MSEIPNFAVDRGKAAVYRSTIGKQKELTQMNDIPVSNKVALLEDWKATDERLKELRVEEKNKREEVIEAYSEETDEMASGTESIDIGFGHDLKIEHKLTYSFEKISNEEVDKALDEIADKCEGGEILAERLVTWKPSISVSEYKKLPADAKKIIDRVLTIKPSSKSIKIHKRGK